MNKQVLYISMLLLGWSAGIVSAAPSAPSSLRATGAGTNKVNLTWNDNSSIERGFAIYRKTEPSGTWSQVKTVEPNVENWTDFSVQPGTPYRYRMRAWDKDSNVSAWSNEDGATTDPLPTPIPPATQPSTLPIEPEPEPTPTPPTTLPAGVIRVGLGQDVRTIAHVQAKMATNAVFAVDAGYVIAGSSTLRVNRDRVVFMKIGDGPDFTIRNTSTNTEPTVIEVTGDYCHFSDIAVEGPKKAQGFRIGKSDDRAIGCTIKDSVIPRNVVGTWVHSKNSDGLTLENCQVLGARRYGVFGDPYGLTKGLRMIDCTVLASVGGAGQFNSEHGGRFYRTIDAQIIRCKFVEPKKSTLNIRDADGFLVIDCEFIGPSVTAGPLMDDDGDPNADWDTKNVSFVGCKVKGGFDLEMGSETTVERCDIDAGTGAAFELDYQREYAVRGKASGVVKDSRIRCGRLFNGDSSKFQVSGIVRY